MCDSCCHSAVCAFSDLRSGGRSLNCEFFACVNFQPQEFFIACSNFTSECSSCRHESQCNYCWR